MQERKIFMINVGAEYIQSFFFLCMKNDKCCGFYGCALLSSRPNPPAGGAAERSIHASKAEIRDKLLTMNACRAESVS
jgi:hypothetical protein